MLGGNPVAGSPAATSLLYAGEHFDTNAQMYYNRARWYNPLNGLFNRVDPYAGNTQDPQSLHKYIYCHNNPINGIDPSGQSLISMISGISIVTILATIMTLTTMHLTNIRAKTNLAIFYLDPYNKRNNNMRELIISRKNEIQNQFNTIVQTRIVDGAMPEGRERYRYGIYRVKIGWDDNMEVVGYAGFKNLISLSAKKFKKDVELWAFTNSTSLSDEEWENCAANTLMHEMVHVIYNRNWLRNFPQHEGSGLMSGSPNAGMFKNGLLPFSSLTKKRLRSAIGTRL